MTNALSRTGSFMTKLYVISTAIFIIGIVKYLLVCLKVVLVLITKMSSNF